MLNYAKGGAKFVPGGRGHDYVGTCREEELFKSLPHVVYIATGYMDTMSPNYSEENYENVLMALIKKI